MAERKFTLGLNKPGMAAQLRENVSQVVRESAVLVSDYLYCFFFARYQHCLIHVLLFRFIPYSISFSLPMFKTAECWMWSAIKRQQQQKE